MGLHTFHAALSAPAAFFHAAQRRLGHEHHQAVDAQPAGLPTARQLYADKRLCFCPNTPFQIAKLLRAANGGMLHASAIARLAMASV